MKHTLILIVLLVVVATSTNAQIITTIAGNSIAAYSGDGGPAIVAEMFNPSGVSIDSSGNVYIADNINNRIRKVNNAGLISTLAGNGIAAYGGDGGLAVAAELSSTSCVVVDSHGNVYISDQGNNRIRKVDTAGIITTVVGNGISGYTGDGGQATAAEISDNLWSINIDKTGNLYIADLGENVIRKVDTFGIISTIAGNNIMGYAGDGGPATAAKLSHPSSVAVDSAGNIFISDYNNNVIRKVTALTSIISTIAGNDTAGYSGDGAAATSAKINSPGAIAVDNMGNIFFADGLNNVIRKINTAGIITTVVGNGFGSGTGSGGYSGDGGLATAAELFAPSGIVFDAVGNMYISDENNNVIRKVSSIIGSGSVCVSSAITLSDGVAGGVWSSSNGNATIGSTGIVTGISAGLDTIRYTVTNGTHTSTATAVVTINPLPDAGTVGGVSVVCIGSLIDLTDAAIGGVWSSNSHATVSGGIVTGVTAGLDTIRYTVTNTCGTAIALHTVTVNPLPIAGVISGMSTVCTGATITLSDTATGGLWSATNGNATVSGGVISGITSGVDTVEYIVINSCGVATASKTVTINPSPDAGVISGMPTVCAGDTISLSDTIVGGTWTSTAITTASIGSTGKVAGIASGTATISYTITNSCGAAAATKVVTVNPMPNAGTINGTDTVCTSLTASLSDFSTGGVWSSTNPAIGTISTTGTVNGISIGTVTISYTVANSCGTVAATKVITVHNCTTGINVLAHSVAEGITIFPNPASSSLTVASTQNISVVAIINILGKIVYSGSYNSDAVQIDVSTLPSGVYFIKVNGTEIRKFMKQ